MRVSTTQHSCVSWRSMMTLSIHPCTKTHVSRQHSGTGLRATTRLTRWRSGRFPISDTSSRAAGPTDLRGGCVPSLSAVRWPLGLRLCFSCLFSFSLVGPRLSAPLPVGFIAPRHRVARGHSSRSSGRRIFAKRGRRRDGALSWASTSDACIGLQKPLEQLKQ